jgi:AAA domain-containing protein
VSEAQTQTGAQMAALRSEVDWLINEMNGVGVRPAEIARRAGMTGSYLSQLRRVAAYPKKQPSPAAMSRLVRTLRMATEENAASLRMAGPEIIEAIDARLRGLEVRVASVLPPPGPPLPVSAASYVVRDVDRKLAVYLRNRTTDLQTFLISGPPACGKTSLLRQLAGGTPGFATTVIVDLARIGTSAATGTEHSRDATLAFAEACLVATGRPDDPALEDDPVFALREAQTVLDDRGSSLLLVDSANSDLGSAAAGQIARQWNNRARTDSVTAPVRLVLFASYGSQTESVARSSLIENTLPDLTRLALAWFTRTEVDILAERYLAAGTGSAVGASDAARLAYDWFRGQPLLTHQMVEDLLLTGMTAEEAVAEMDRPGTNYEAHLKRLTHLLKDKERPDLLAEALAATRDQPRNGPWEILLETLGVANREPFEDSDGSMTVCSCRFYRKHLSRFLAERLARTATAAADNG